MENNMNNEYYYGYAQPQMQGQPYVQQPYVQQPYVQTPYQYASAPYAYNVYNAQPVQPPREENAITEEEIRTIANEKAPSQLDINIKQTDVIRSMCTHRRNGQSVVQLLNDGSGDVWCPICGARWSQDILDKEEVIELVNRLLGVMQNDKWAGYLPIELTRELYPLMPLLMKYPDIHEYALNNLNKYFGQYAITGAQDSSIYRQYDSLFGGNYYAYAQQPMTYAQPMQTQPAQATTNTGYYYQQPQQTAPVQNPYVNPMQAPTYGVNPAAPNQQFVQQAANMMVNPYGQPAYQAAPAPTYAPATTAAPATPQGYQPAASAVDSNVKNNADGTTTSENKIDL